MITFKTRLNFTISFTVIHSVAVYNLHPYIRSSSSSSAFCPAQAWHLSRSWGRQRCRVLAGFSSRYLVLEDHAEQLPSQPVSKPRVLDNGHLEALTAEHGVVVGVDGSAHALDYYQVGFSLPHQHGQYFVQAAGDKFISYINFLRGTSLFSRCASFNITFSVDNYNIVSTAGPACTYNCN